MSSRAEPEEREPARQAIVASSPMPQRPPAKAWRQASGPAWSAPASRPQVAAQLSRSAAQLLAVPPLLSVPQVVVGVVAELSAAARALVVPVVAAQVLVLRLAAIVQRLPLAALSAAHLRVRVRWPKTAVPRVLLGARRCAPASAARAASPR